MIFVLEEVPYKYIAQFESLDLMWLEVYKNNRLIHKDLILIKNSNIQWADWHLREEYPTISKSAIKYIKI